MDNLYYIILSLQLLNYILLLGVICADLYFEMKYIKKK